MEKFKTRKEEIITKSMKNFNPEKIARDYSFENRGKTNVLLPARKLLSKKFRKSRILLIGFGGTISSGYTPTHETIVPLHPSPAIKQIKYLNLFGISNIPYDRLDFLAKDSREITTKDIAELLDVIHMVPNDKILITAGTYMLPKIAEIIARVCGQLSKRVVLTGSILPAGFVASDADANIWSAITVLNNTQKPPHKESRIFIVFHGRVFSSVQEFQKLNFHQKKTQKMVIQYPLSVVPVKGVL